jgi:YVTN family beta-propeller protein
MTTCKKKGTLVSLLLASILGVNVQSVDARTTNPVGDFEGGSLLPTGQTITPTAAPGSTFERLATGLRSDGTADAAEAVTTALSPDGKTLLVLTSGYNLNFKDEAGNPITYPVLDPTTGAPSSQTTSKAEWVFVYDVGTGRLVKKQQLNIPNTYDGIAWAPDSKRFYVSAGVDDRIYVYSLKGSQFVPDAPFILLGHNSNQTAPFSKDDGGLLNKTPAATASTGATVAGVAVSKDGKTLVAANFQNDSISIVDTSTRKVLNEIKFFEPGGKVATGEFPYDVAVKSTGDGAAAKAYVSSQRDDEVLAVDIVTKAVTRIPVGDQPNKILLSPDQNLLYVANGNSDTVSVIDTNSDKVIKTISLSRPGDKYKGANPNSLALSPNEDKLYVTLGVENAVAVVNLETERVAGRIPTGWYPNSVSVSQDGRRLYVINAKSTSGPNPSNGRTTDAGKARNTNYRNEYDWALEKAGIAMIPVPSGNTLLALSARVDQNNGVANRRPDPMMTFLRKKIKHIVYVVKENRTYDEILGDLPIGNGDPALTLFPQAISPNHHQLALNFATLDNFYDSGESSGVGWNWSTYARTTDYTEKAQSVNYGNGSGNNGITYDYEGTNRNINVALPETAPNPSQLTVRSSGLLDPSGNSAILPGSKDVSAPQGDGDLEENAIGGYLWDAALRAGKSVRNYGFFIDLEYYNTASSSTDPTKPDPGNPFYIPISQKPFEDKIPQSPAAKVVLQDKTDIYYRGYDNKAPDFYRYQEWARDFAKNGLPALSLVRIMHDHFGSFSQAVGGLNTVELQMADNDYALGLLVEAISKSPEWKDTAIFVIEDDSQDGPDHVDSHRSIGYVISPYTKHKALISTNYNTVSMLRTMEDLLGIDHLSITDANAEPMSDVFTQKPDLSPYTAIVPGNLCASPVDPNLIPACKDPKAVKTAAIPSRHDGKWWAQATKNFSFEVEDKVDPAEFNHITWVGVKGDNIPYPTQRNRINLRQNRAQLLKNWRLRISGTAAALNK